MVLFCKGDFKSVYMLLQGIKLFAATTGLKASPSKSDFYSCGLTEKENRRISESSWFKHGNLPFKYLGLPISIKKLSADCEKLIDKMMIRIRIWSTGNISFAGRRQSLNVVLLSINVYWSQIFILPKVVLKQINSIFTAFLWTGTCNSSKPGYVSWEDVYRPRSHGGLGFRAFLSWNMAIVENWPGILLGRLTICGSNGFMIDILKSIIGVLLLPHMVSTRLSNKYVKLRMRS